MKSIDRCLLKSTYIIYYDKCILSFYSNMSIKLIIYHLVNTSNGLLYNYSIIWIDVNYQTHDYILKSKTSKALMCKTNVWKLINWKWRKMELWRTLRVKRSQILFFSLSKSVSEEIFMSTTMLAWVTASVLLVLLVGFG